MYTHTTFAIALCPFVPQARANNAHLCVATHIWLPPSEAIHYAFVRVVNPVVTELRFTTTTSELPYRQRHLWRVIFHDRCGHTDASDDGHDLRSSDPGDSSAGSDSVDKKNCLEVFFVVLLLHPQEVDRCIHKKPMQTTAVCAIGSESVPMYFLLRLHTIAQIWKTLRVASVRLTLPVLTQSRDVDLIVEKTAPT